MARRGSSITIDNIRRFEQTIGVTLAVGAWPGGALVIGLGAAW